jgi:hypothetical protein
VIGGYEVFVPFRNFVSVDSLDWSSLTFHCVPFLSPPIRKPSQTQTLAVMRQVNIGIAGNIPKQIISENIALDV